MMSSGEDRDPFAFARLGEGDAELFALLAEYRSAIRATEQMRRERESRGDGLPPLPVVRVEIGRMNLWDGTQEAIYAENEEHLKRRGGLRDLAMAATLRHPRAKEWKHTEIYHDRLDEVIAELHSQRAAGDSVHGDWTAESLKQAEVVRQKIQAIQPVTLAGVVALIEFWREHELDGWPEQAIASLREIVAQEPRW